MGRKVGGGIGMGKTCEPKAFSFQCMTKFTTNKKKRKKENKFTLHLLKTTAIIVVYNAEVAVLRFHKKSEL